MSQLDDTTTASTLLAGMVAKFHQRILAMHAGTLAGEDPEFLHKMRTSTRRLRAALRLCRGVVPKAENKALRGELSWLAGELGRVRDLDVMILELPRLLAAEHGHSAPPPTALLAWLEDARDEARLPLGPALRSGRYDRLVASLAEAARPEHRGRKAGRSAARLLQPRLAGLLEQVYAQAADITPASPDEQLHRLRILNKKLRYGCELAEPVLSTAAYGSILRIPHDLLGEHQDASVAEEWVRAFAEASPELPDTHRDAWLGRLAQRRAELRARFMGELPRLRAELGDPSAASPLGLAAVLTAGV